MRNNVSRKQGVQLERVRVNVAGTDGAIELRIRRPLLRHTVVSIGLGAGMFALGSWTSALGSQDSDSAFWLAASLFITLYVLVGDWHERISIWKDRVRLDFIGESVLLDRSQQLSPVWNPDSRLLTFGSGGRRVVFGRGLSDEDLAVVEASFVRSQHCAPQPLKSQNLLTSSIRLLLKYLIVMVVFGFSLIYGVTDIVTYVGLALIASLVFVLSDVWNRQYPKRLDIDNGSG